MALSAIGALYPRWGCAEFPLADSIGPPSISPGSLCLAQKSCSASDSSLQPRQGLRHAWTAEGYITSVRDRAQRFDVPGRISVHWHMDWSIYQIRLYAKGLSEDGILVVLDRHGNGPGHTLDRTTSHSGSGACVSHSRL